MQKEQRTFLYGSVDVGSFNADGVFDECSSYKHQFNFGARTYNDISL